MIDTFFENIDHIASTPNAVAKLRELVLHLAVHGRLVEQDGREEPASVLIKRLQNQKITILKSPHLPNSWVFVLLGDIVKLQKGQKPGSLNTEHRGLPYLDIAALEHGIFRQFTEDINHPRSTDDDLIIVCDGSRSGLVLDGGNGILGSTVSKIIFAEIERGYLRIFLTSLYKDLNGSKKGAAIPHLNIPRLLLHPFPIPPLIEQKRIVSKVDELMAVCDRLEAQLQERDTRHAALARATLDRFAEEPTLENLELLFHESFAIEPADLRITILSMAFQGHLVPQNREEGTGAELLQQIKSQNTEAGSFSGARRKSQSLIDPFDCRGVFQIPPVWAWTYLDFLCKKIADVDHNMPKAVSNGIPFISAKDLKDDGTIDFSAPKLISEEDYRRLSRKVQIQRDDIIYSRIGARLGKARLVKVDTRFLISYSCCLIRPKHEFIEKRYLQLFLDSSLALKQAHKGAQSIGVPDLGIGEIRSFQVPVPPLTEQRRIVAKVDQLMVLVDQYESKLNASREMAEKLLNAMVTELTIEA